MRRVATMAFLASTLVLVACASSGQETPQTEVDGPVVSEAQHDPDREFSDDEVDSFAAAYIDVTSVQQDYRQRIQAADDEQMRQQLSEQSNAEAEEKMREHGMTPAQYNAIAVRLPEDDELRQRVQQAVQQLEEERIEETEQQLERP